MSIEEIYNLAIKLGIDHDPRGREGVTKFLKRQKKEYEQLSENKKKLFDQESLKNPYADTRILFGDKSTIVDKVLVGIDIGVGEVVLADRLNEKGEGIDLIIAHHPEGPGLAGLHEVMDLQVEHFHILGVPVHIAEGVMRERISEVRRKINPRNHLRAVDAARLLNIPLMSIHTPTDNLVYDFLKKEIKKHDLDKVEDVLEMLLEIPEYRDAAINKAGPMVFAGSPKNRAGKVVPAEVTGGTEAAKEIYERLSKAGIGTIIGMHASEEHKKEAEKQHLNLVIAGHISSDSVGINIFLDGLEKQGVSVLPCSGLIRFKRN